MYKSLVTFLLFAASGSCLLFSCTSPPSGGKTDQKDSAKLQAEADSAFTRNYDFRDLQTDFTKHSVPLDSIKDGGVSKNSIPAIDFPEFFTVKDAQGFLSSPDYGILIEGEKEIRYYPLSILNWHEIVNDELEGIPLAITFCPLCGSGIVYERIVDGDTLQFGVSGKLYESNLLMFDDKNESLWSQSMGEAVAGAYTGKKLKLVNSSVVAYEDVITSYPEAKVLSPRTGYDRNYSQYPYADYMSSEELYFPVSKTDNRFPAKEMMYVVSAGNEKAAFAWLPLLKKGGASLKTPSGTIIVKVVGNVPVATMNNESLPAYFSFWFSWFTHYGESGLIWTGK